jgi:hypothetical protein
MKITFQIADIAVEVTGHAEILGAFARYVGAAVYTMQPKRHVTAQVETTVAGYRLPSGRTEISPEITAEVLWLEVEAKVRDLLKDWLQMRGICIADEGGCLLVTGDDQRALRLAAVEAMGAGLDVASATGVCLKAGRALPYALPLHMMESELRQADPSGLRFSQVRLFHDEMGHRRSIISPSNFRKVWHVPDLPLHWIVDLQWNEGGRTCLGILHQHQRLERVLEAMYIPDSLAVGERVDLITQAKRLAEAVPIHRLQVGRLQDFPAALQAHLGVNQEHA